MSHEPPVPPGNQSPYPIKELPHAPAPASPPLAAAPRRRKLPLGAIAGTAAGIGAVAIGIAALLFPREGKAKKAGARKRRR